MKSLESLSDVLTPEEVGDILKLPPEEIIKLLESGELSGVKVGPIWRVLKVNLFELLHLPTSTSEAYDLRPSGEEEVKIGELVRSTMTELLSAGRLPADEIENLKSLAYSKRVFGLTFPLFREYLPGQDINAQRMVKSGQNEYPRYWKKVFPGNLLITSEWTTRHRQRFIGWARQFQR